MKISILNGRDRNTADGRRRLFSMSAIIWRGLLFDGIPNKRSGIMISRFVERKSWLEQINRNNVVITTENIDVSITEAKEATLNEKSVGLVNCKATISGTRDGIDFQNIYDLSLLLSYDTDPVGIYVVKSIAKE